MHSQSWHVSVGAIRYVQSCNRLQPRNTETCAQCTQQPAVYTPKWSSYLIPAQQRQSVNVNKLNLIRFCRFHFCVFIDQNVLFAVTFCFSLNFVPLCLTFQYTCVTFHGGELCEYLCCHLLPPAERKFLHLFIPKVPFGVFSCSMYTSINNVIKVSVAVFIFVAMENLKR